VKEPIALPYGDSSFVADPFPFYRRLREQGRVVRVTTGTGHESYLITRYDDVLAALKDPRMSSDFQDSADPRLVEALSSDSGAWDRSLLRVNPPDHTRLPGNAHLAFGYGPHYCIGAPLARLEAQIAIDTAVRRLPGLKLAVPYEELRWPAATARGPGHLPVTFDPS
jgi:cytochrome P450